jgi:hypothetical protein
LNYPATFDVRLTADAKLPDEGLGAHTHSVACFQEVVGLLPQVIGHIQTAIGSSTLTRACGIAVRIKVDDPVCQGDVIETAAGGRVGIRFIDGTAFDLSSSARMVLNDFVCDSTGTSHSVLFGVTGGTFAFIVGQVAKTDYLRIDTPVGSIRGRARTGGIGMLSLTALTFAVMKEVQAASSDVTLLDDGNITYSDLEHGVFELVTRDGRHIIVDNPGETIVLSRTGSITVVANSDTRMAELRQAQQDALATYALGTNAAPTSTGGGGSPPPFSSPQGLQPINFIQPDAPTAPHDSPGATTATQGSPAFEVFITGPVLRTIDVAPVVDQPNFKIADIVTITDSQPLDTLVPYVPGTATIVSAAGPSDTPAGINLASLVTTDPQTGTVSYNPHSFAFLKPGEQVIVTIGFDSSAGTNTFHQTTTLTINSPDPTVTIATPGGTTGQHSHTISGSVTAAAGEVVVGSTVTLVDTYNGVTTPLGITATVQADGSWTANVTLVGDGAHSIVALDTDLAGNPGTSAPVVFTLHTVTPTVTVAVNSADVNVAHPTATVTFTFSQAPTDFTLVHTSAVGGTLCALTPNADGTVYTALFTANPGTDIANGSVTVDNTWHDADGNLGTGSTSPLFVVDTLTPTVTIDPVDGNDVINSAEAHAAAGVPLTGTVTGLAAAAHFNVTVTDNGVTNTYIATVNGAGTNWTATIPTADAIALANGTATVSAQVTDINGNLSTVATQLVTVAETLPTVTAGGTATFTGGGTAVVLDAGLLVTDVDSGDKLNGATVKISAGFLGGDTLNFTNANGITGTYNAATGVLTLNGTATVEQYQAALESITYSFNPPNGDPTALGTDNTRIISWVVNDGVNGSSAPATSTLTDGDSWTHSGNGLWITSTDWSNDVPIQNENVAIDATGTYTVTSTTNVDIGNLLVNSGVTLLADPDTVFTVEGNLVNNGTVAAGPFSSNNISIIDIKGNVSGTGSLDISNEATIEIGGSVSSGQTMTFGAAGGAATLILDDSHNFHGTIVGLTEFPTESLENQVDLKDLKFISGHMSAHFSSGVVTVSNGTDSVSLKVSGSSDTAFELATDKTGAGGTLLSDPPASGTVTIDSGKTLDISGASAATVSFTNSNGTTGELVLDNSQAFTGQIVGFAGDGTLANSDTIDLQDINFAKLNTETYVQNAAGTGGTLTLSDGTNTASLNFSGNHVSENFKFLSDGNGGTDLADNAGTASNIFAISENTVDPTSATVASGGSLELNAASGESVTFTGGTGSLVLDQPGGFIGHIVGFTGTAPDAAHSDTIDLVGIDFNSFHFAESYNSSTGLLTVSDGTHNASFTFDNFNATLDFASDGKGGTLITDPPASGVSGAAATAPAELGIKLVDHKIGTVSAQSNDKFTAAIGLDGPEAALVSLRSGDNFVFRHSLETDSNANTNSHDHANEFTDRHDAQSAHALAALISLDAHTEATFEFTQNDALTAQMHQVIQAGHALLQ